MKYKKPINQNIMMISLIKKQVQNVKEKTNKQKIIASDVVATKKKRRDPKMEAVIRELENVLALKRSKECLGSLFSKASLAKSIEKYIDSKCYLSSADSSLIVEKVILRIDKLINENNEVNTTASASADLVKVKKADLNMAGMIHSKADANIVLKPELKVELQAYSKIVVKAKSKLDSRNIPNPISKTVLKPKAKEYSVKTKEEITIREKIEVEKSIGAELSNKAESLQPLTGVKSLMSVFETIGRIETYKVEFNYKSKPISERSFDFKNIRGLFESKQQEMIK